MKGPEESETPSTGLPNLKKVFGLAIQEHQSNGE